MVGIAACSESRILRLVSDNININISEDSTVGWTTVKSFPESMLPFVARCEDHLDLAVDGP